MVGLSPCAGIIWETNSELRSVTSKFYNERPSVSSSVNGSLMLCRFFVATLVTPPFPPCTVKGEKEDISRERDERRGGGKKSVALFEMEANLNFSFSLLLSLHICVDMKWGGRPR